MKEIEQQNKQLLKDIDKFKEKHHKEKKAKDDAEKRIKELEF